MSRALSRLTTIAEFWFVLMILSSASGLQQQQTNGPVNQLPLENVPSSLSQGSTDSINSQSQGFLNARDWPLVNVDNANNKSVVDVHVPIFFDMTNQADKNTGGEKLDLSVMHGLVTVKKDKSRNQNGDLTGPVKVTVFGIPVYTSKGSQQEASVRSMLDDSSASKRFEPVGAGLATNSSSLVSQVKVMNEKLASSLSDILERIAGNLRRVGSQQTGDQIPSRDKMRPITQDQGNEVNVKLADNRAL